MKQTYYKGLIAILLMLALLLGGCGLLPQKTDAVTTATQASEGPSKEPRWQVVTTDQIQSLFKDSDQNAAFIWYNGKELLVVGDLSDTPLPSIDPSFNAINKAKLGYSFVAASPEAFLSIQPDYLIVAIPTMAEDELEVLKVKLKDTLAGKAMQTLALDRFYFWQYED